MGDNARAHVVFVTITFHPEPGAMRGLPLARALVNSGEYDVTVITAIPWYPLGHFYPGYRLRLWQWEAVEGVRILRLPLYPSHNRSALRRATTYLTFFLAALLIAPWRVRRGDIIYHVDNLPTTGLLACLLGAIWSAPVVQHIGDLWPDTVQASGMTGHGLGARLVTRALDRIQRFIYARNTIVSVITDGFARVLVSRGVPQNKLVVIPNWADEEQFVPVERDEATRRELGITVPFAVIFAGNVGPLQALDVILDAAERLRNDHDIVFVIVGDGPSLPALRLRADRTRLPNVRFAGRWPIQRMAAVNAAADALLIHLKDEPFLHSTVPSKTQIALLAGRPILMGARGEAAEIIRSCNAGIVFTPEDGGSLASAIRELAALAPAEREAMGARGSQFYHDRLSMTAGITTMQRLFAQVRAR